MSQPDSQKAAGSETPPEADPRAAGSRFSDLHTRTFEMELLISGAVVFALLQLPAFLRTAFGHYASSTSDNLRVVGVYGFVYTSMIVYSLLVFFVVHLACRAFWIGLVGLESVFPGGYRWQRIEMGPYQRRWLQGRLPELPRLIDRLDDLCSLIFSVAFMIVLTSIYSIAVVLVSGAVALVASWTPFIDLDATTAFWATFVVVLLPQIVLRLIDKRWGDRVDPDRWGGRLLAALTRWLYWISPMPLIGSTQVTLQGRFSERKVALFMFASVMLLGFGMVATSLVSSGELGLDSRVYFPDDLTQAGLDPRFYRDQTGSDAVDRQVPSIQSDVLRAPYLKLFLPYYPHRHNQRLEALCPDVAPLRSAGLFVTGDPTYEPSLLTEIQGCFRRLFVVTLDGRTLEKLGVEFSRDATSGTAGVMVYVPTRGLAPGSHELVVVEVQQPGSSETRGRDRERRYRIPFWR